MMGYEEPASFVHKLLPFQSGLAGLPYARFRSIKPAHKCFNKSMSYRSYLLMIIAYRWSSKPTADVLVLIKNLTSPWKTCIQRQGPDPCFQCFRPFHERRQNGQHVWGKGTYSLAKYSGRTSRNAIPHKIKRSVTRRCWPWSIQYLLRTKVTSSAMCQVLEDHRNIRQETAEVE